MGVRGVSELASGASGQLSLNATTGRKGGLRMARVFRVLTEQPADIYTIDLQAECGVTVGDPYPGIPAAVCDSLDFKADGDSRLCWMVTANYNTSDIALESGSQNSQEPDPRSQSPEVRLANWHASTTTIEVPSWYWQPVDAAGNVGAAVPARNPVNDMYDGITILQPVVNITVEQYATGDPLVFSSAVGKVNSNQGKIGSLNLFPRSVLLRNVSFKPHTEQVGKRTWRGWKCEFEFAYKPNYNNYLGIMLGWDIAIPITGFNCRNNRLNANDVENGALALELLNGDDFGVIKGWPGNAALCPGLVGAVVRANVLIAPNIPGVKASQRPCAQPIPLNLDGTPRKNSLPPLLQRAQVYDSFDMSTLGLRLTR